MPAHAHTRIVVTSIGPFDLALSLNAMASFMPAVMREADAAARTILPLESGPVSARFRQTSMRPATVEVSIGTKADRAELQQAAAWTLAADLDLRPFYRQAKAHPVLAALTRSLRGLKPLRPASLFEIAVIAITEQQISLAAAHHIRNRLIARFGQSLGDATAFPQAEALAQATPQDLLACGISHRKAEYIAELAGKVAQGTLDLDALRAMSDDAARALICALRGFGPWSADYILVRGLGRVDCVPTDDLGVRDAVGEYLGGRGRASPHAVDRLLEPLAPFRGLAVFYLLVQYRLERARSGRPARRA
jgi:DNA-3-methyladenine glycosylase II